MIGFRPPGQIITFYSYKGGTGRSMALANVAWILAANGMRVLVIDWDLEAPGLHRYFRPFLTDPDLVETKGLIDVFWEMAALQVAHGTSSLEPFDVHAPNNARSDAHPATDTPPPDLARALMSTTRRLKLPPVVQSANPDGITEVQDDNPFLGAGCIDFIGAGRQGGSYSERVNTFDWRGFYELGGANMLIAAAGELKTPYQWILIDSRTGVSDTSGICTIQMPDTLVACFTLNRQSIEGVAAVLMSIHSQRQARNPNGARPVAFFPLAMRIENAEKTKLDNARNIMRRTFSPWLPSQYGRNPRRYWDQMEITYWPYYAYEELLAAFGDRGGTSGAAKTLLSELEVMARCITGLRHLQAPALSDDLRRKVLLEYSFGPMVQSAPVENTPSEPTRRSSASAYEGTSGSVGQTGQNVFISCGLTGTQIAQVVHEYINTLSDKTRVVIGSSARLSGGTDWHRELERQLSESAMLILIYTSGDDLSYPLYETGFFISSSEARGESPRIVILTSDYEGALPAAFQNFYIISIPKDVQKARIDAIVNLGRAILELAEPERISDQDISTRIVPWAQRATEAIGAAMTDTYSGVVSESVEFQHRLVFTMHRNFDENVDVRTTLSTLRLFGLSGATEQIKWNVIKTSLLDDENRWWAEELEKIITEALSGRNPTSANQVFVATDGSLYRSVIQRFTVTTGGMYTVTIFLIQIQDERDASDVQVTSIQMLLAVTKYQKEVVQWALDNSRMMKRSDEDRYWQELYRRLKGVVSSAVAGGLTGSESLRVVTARSKTLAQTLDVWSRDQHELLAIVDKGQSEARPEREQLVRVLNELWQTCSSVISELALEIGSSAEGAGTIMTD